MSERFDVATPVTPGKRRNRKLEIGRNQIMRAYQALIWDSSICARTAEGRLESGRY
jgi:hypothetical protein